MHRLLAWNSLFFGGVVLSYPAFFIINPFASGLTILGVLQLFSTAGWIITICLPLVNWLIRALGASKWLMVASILLWPISLLLIRIYVGVLTGDPGFQYLISYPIFFVTDVAAPLLLTWWMIVDARTSSKRPLANV